jgi:hypothetical protein
MLTQHRLMIVGAATLIAMATPSLANAERPSVANAERPSGDEPEATLLLTGLAGGFGSTIGPDGALYVAEPQAARIRRASIRPLGRSLRSPTVCPPRSSPAPVGYWTWPSSTAPRTRW